MSESRRQFLKYSSLAMMSAAAGCGGNPSKPAGETPGAPPAFGTSPPSGPEVSTGTFVEAEKLAQIEMTQKDLDLAARTWRENMSSVIERRVGPRKVALEADLAPYSR